MGKIVQIFASGGDVSCSVFSKFATVPRRKKLLARLVPIYLRRGSALRARFVVLEISRALVPATHLRPITEIFHMQKQVA